MIPRCRSITAFVVIDMLMTLGCIQPVAADSIQDAGDILQFVLPATAIGLTIGHSDGAGAIELGKSVAVSMGVTYALKDSINAKRPNGGDHSFPSGHSSLSFSAAEFMRKRYGWRYGAPAYVGAAFVAYSRVEAREHYVQDVVAGAGIGILSSYIFTTPHTDWQVNVEGDTKSFGVRFARRF